MILQDIYIQWKKVASHPYTEKLVQLFLSEVMSKTSDVIMCRAYSIKLYQEPIVLFTMWNSNGVREHEMKKDEWRLELIPHLLSTRMRSYELEVLAREKDDDFKTVCSYYSDLEKMDDWAKATLVIMVFILVFNEVHYLIFKNAGEIEFLANAIFHDVFQE